MDKMELALCRNAGFDVIQPIYTSRTFSLAAIPRPPLYVFNINHIDLCQYISYIMSPPDCSIVRQNSPAATHC